MVGVFVAFIRVVYGRMIYMSLPGCVLLSLHTTVCSRKHLRQVKHWVNVYCVIYFAPIYWKTIITNMNIVGN